MDVIHKITVLIVNYRTLDLTRRCLESLLLFYPQAGVLLIDNGSGDDSSEYIAGVAARSRNITAIFNPTNHYHGPALDQGLRHPGAIAVRQPDVEEQMDLLAGGVDIRHQARDGVIGIRGQMAAVTATGQEAADGFTHLEAVKKVMSGNF